MIWLISLVTSLGVPAKLAKPVLAIVGAIALVGALWGLKSLYDHRVIAAHEAKQEAATAKADKKADNHAADQRAADQARQTTEATQIKEAVDHAKDIGADPRAAYYACVRVQQAARASGKPPARC